LSEDVIQNVNWNLDGFFGVVDTYSVLGKRSDGRMKIRMNLNVSDNTSVWKRLVEHDETAELSEDAQKLYDACIEVMTACVQDGMSDFDKEVAIHDYLIINGAFAQDYKETSQHGDESVYKAYGALVDKIAVCNGYAEAMYLLLNACDIECQMVVGKADGSDHAWNIVRLDGDWYQVDATWDDPTPDREGVAQRDYLNLTDAQMSDSHEWNTDNYPACNSEKYNYFVYHKLVCSDYITFRDKVNNKIAKGRKNITLLVKDYDEQQYDLSFIMDSHANVSKATYGTNKVAQGTVVTLHITY
jgi:hypothetical protein